jgi:hypothetical protein
LQTWHRNIWRYVKALVLLLPLTLRGLIDSF